LKPADVLNITTGFPASILINSEYDNIPCLLVTSVVDSHFVTDDTLKAFAPVVNGLIGNQNIQFEKISSCPGYKHALKDANLRENIMFT
jgi:hypothetical protein